MRLDGRIVAITGSGSGLGREGAKLFASEGAKVMVSDLVPGRAQRVAEEIADAGGTAAWLNADVRHEDDIERLVATSVERFGGLDVMWANAGIPEPGLGQVGFADSTLAGWNEVIAVNLTGIYLAFRIAARHMIAAGRGGNLMATTSAAAFVAYPGYPMYSASKSGGNGLVRAAAFELGRYGIRANALAPVHGMSVNFLLSPEADVVGQSYEQLRPWNPDHRAMPLNVGRPPTLADHAQLALFLASDASAYMSGQTIQSVDGGTFARPAIVFPVDQGEADPGPSRVVPEALRGLLRTTW